MNEPETPEVVLPPKDELTLVVDFFRRHGNRLAYLVAIVLVVIIVLSGYRSREDAKLRQASDKFWAARSAQDLEIVLEDFPDSPAAPLALLKAAKEYFDTGKYSVAIKRYDDFQVKYPKHYMVDVARMGEFHCREAMGQTKEAAKGFATFAADKPEHYLTPQAIMGQARCLEHLGQYEEAQAIYEEFIKANANTPWAMKADARLKLVRKRKNRAAVSVTVPIPPSGTEAMTPGVGPTNAAPLIDLSGFKMQ